jgi:hypothetical protein
VEATVAALGFLEPDTNGFDQLLRAFETMVEGQLAHSGSSNAHRFRRPKNRTFKNIPLALAGDLGNIVVAYGESAAGERGRKRIAGPPIYWVAQRLGTGETFSCTLIPPRPLDNAFLEHLELTRANFDTALSLDEARIRWAQFQRPNDVVAVFHSGTALLFSYLARDRAPCLVLKSVDLEPNPNQLLLEGFLSSPRVPVAPAQNPGRGGRRLAEAIEYVRHLNAVANARLRENEPIGRRDVQRGRAENMVCCDPAAGEKTCF